MSNLAMGLLYELVNDDTPHLCDRCFTPLPDMADAMRAQGHPALRLGIAPPTT